MNNQLKIIDYLMLSLTLIAYAVIGIYFGCFGSKQKSTREYLYGRGKLSAFPIGLSIFSSSISGIAMLGVPSEIYVFGIQYTLQVVGVFLSVLVTSYLILPVFNGTQSFKSPYEYYEHRFNENVKKVSTIIYACHASLSVPIILYSCSLLISDALGINVLFCSTIVGAVCIIYTTLGGFVTVIWTDALQAVIMFVALISLGIVGVIKAGGFEAIWTNADNGGRIFFDLDPNPFKRLSIWSAIIGGTTTFVGHMGSSASALQRYLSVKTEKEARNAIFVGGIGVTINTIIGAIIGLSMYTIFMGCDPVANQELKNYNQLTSHFALNITKHIPGFTGLLIAGLLSAGLSSMSSDLNTLSGIIYHDFIWNKTKRSFSESKGALIMKLLVVLFGIYYILMVLVVQHVKYLIPITLTISGTAGGLKLGLLILGTTFPKANTKGVLCGIITSAAFMCWIGVNATIYSVGSLAELPVSTDNCTQRNETANFNQTSALLPLSLKYLSTEEKPEPFWMYKLSFMNYNLLGLIITISVALLVSYATGGNDYEKMDPKLFIPWVRPKKVINQSVNELEECKKELINN